MMDEQVTKSGENVTNENLNNEMSEQSKRRLYIHYIDYKDYTHSLERIVKLEQQNKLMKNA